MISRIISTTIWAVLVAFLGWTAYRFTTEYGFWQIIVPNTVNLIGVIWGTYALRNEIFRKV